MGKGYREGRKFYYDAYICDGCRQKIDIKTDEIFCYKCINNRNTYIDKLEKEIRTLKSKKGIL